MSKEDWDRLKKRSEARIIARENVKLENQLLPCPFCGKIPKKFEYNLNEDSDYSHIVDMQYSVNCETKGCYLEDCGREIGYNTFEEAVKKWNTRI